MDSQPVALDKEIDSCSIIEQETVSMDVYESNVQISQRK